MIHFLVAYVATALQVNGNMDLIKLKHTVLFVLP